MKLAPILDPCCGSRMWHFEKQSEQVLFMDNRAIRAKLCDGRTLEIRPDVLGDFTAMPFPEENFSLVVFDPPHRTHIGAKSWMALKYGALMRDKRAAISYIGRGLSECWRVLKTQGTLIFKWSDADIKVKDLCQVFPSVPVVGHGTRSFRGRANSIFLVFYKAN